MESRKTKTKTKLNKQKNRENGEERETAEQLNNEQHTVATLKGGKMT